MLLPPHSRPPGDSDPATCPGVRAEAGQDQRLRLWSEPGEAAHPVGERVFGQRPVGLVDGVYPGAIVDRTVVAELP